jgi:hypothetical protein
VLKAWAPQKLKSVSWLAMQNRIWMADRLEKRGWQNCGNVGYTYPLCKQAKRIGQAPFHPL